MLLCMSLVKDVPAVVNRNVHDASIQDHQTCSHVDHNLLQRMVEVTATDKRTTWLSAAADQGRRWNMGQVSLTFQGEY